jgi:hypothetical protein
MTRARWRIRTEQHGQASALTTAVLPQPGAPITGISRTPPGQREGRKCLEHQPPHRHSGPATTARPLPAQQRSRGGIRRRLRYGRASSCDWSRRADKAHSSTTHVAEAMRISAEASSAWRKANWMADGPPPEYPNTAARSMLTICQSPAGRVDVATVTGHHRSNLDTRPRGLGIPDLHALAISEHAPPPPEVAASQRTCGTRTGIAPFTVRIRPGR